MIERVGRFFKSSGPIDDTYSDGEHIKNEPPWFRSHAEEISHHGFDAVIFGHTHLEGETRLTSGAQYVNTGSWLFEPHYAEIDHGQVSLKRVDDLTRGSAGQSTPAGHLDTRALTQAAS